MKIPLQKDVQELQISENHAFMDRAKGKNGSGKCPAWLYLLMAALVLFLIIPAV